jgi:indolepyruvate ferredoxin oxidoreductase alpha subunit
MSNPEQRILLGNEAIARGIVESGCHFMASYPGTPSSEILPAIVQFKQENHLDVYVEWSTNEKVALENALVASYTGKRAAVAMKQVGLNVATDPLMSSAYIGTIGGLVIVTCDDPGPHSSQTEQDTRFMAMFAKIPVFDPSSPRDAQHMMPIAFDLSERFQIPVLFRSVTRVSHARQIIEFKSVRRIERKASFQRNPQRWSATPRFRFLLHKQLNRKLEDIAAEFNNLKSVNVLEHERDEAPLGIIAGGICHAMLHDILPDIGLGDDIPVLKIGTPYPLPADLVGRFVERCEHVLVLEETEPVIEMQIRHKTKIHGRLDKAVPSEGEMAPETVARVLSTLCQDLGIPFSEGTPTASLDQMIVDLGLPIRRPSLCSGCPHRASFYALKRALPSAIFTSDIGCYTLGMNMDTVDTCHDMGASITFASGLYHAYHQDGVDVPIVATIGDSTFYHSGAQGLLNSVYNGARFILVILDNSITAMTGMQPTPESGTTADGHPGTPLSIEELVKGCGVQYLRVVNPYHMKDLIREAKRARRYTQQPDGGVAVIIARYPCITHQRDQLKINPIKVDIRHVPPPDRDLPPVKSGAMPRSLLPVYQDKMAPCTAACPIQVDARGYIALVAQERFDEALALVLEKNPFPGITGRLCARPCEKICRRGDVDEPIAIDLLKRFLADRKERIVTDAPPIPKRQEKVAIVGSGPTGLMAAHDLRVQGYGVTIFEALPVAGGTMAMATSRFRLPENVLKGEIENIRRLGVEFRLNTRIGKHLSLVDLKNQGYEAVLLAVGAHQPLDRHVPGSDSEGVMDVLTFLKRTTLEEPIAVGSCVVVIGGTDRALDAARTTVRLGAKRVTVLYGRSRKELPAAPSAIAQAEQEGVRFRFLSVPWRITTMNGRATGVSYRAVHPATPTSLGRTRILSVEGPARRLRADTIITTPDYAPDLSGLADTVPVTSWKTIHVDPTTLATAAEGLFAAGDAVTGPKNFIEALAGGRKAALSIHRYVQREDMRKGREIEGRRMELVRVGVEQIETQPRVKEPALPVAERVRDFREVDRLPDQEAIVAEARRCLHCGACNQCDTCLIQCPEQAISKTDQGYAIDYEKCTGCRVCFQECPTSAIDMPAVGSCIGCGYCLSRFECPSLVRGEDGLVEISRLTCVDCGLCAEVCGQEAIFRVNTA